MHQALGQGVAVVAATAEDMAVHAHAAQQEKDTGHFRLTLKPAGGGAPQVMDFTDGHTETWLAPPAGSYALQLDFVDNLTPGNVLAPPVSAQLRVR